RRSCRPCWPRPTIKIRASWASGFFTYSSSPPAKIARNSAGTLCNGAGSRSGRIGVLPNLMKTVLASVVATAVLACAAPARAELVFFSSGRTMSVKGHRTEGESLVLMLRSGGEIVCDASTVARFAPDEVPYPEPEAAVPAAAAAVATEVGAVPYGEIIDK